MGHYVKSTIEKEPIASFQKIIKQPTSTPHKINQPPTQQHSIGGRGRGAYARYGGGRGRYGSGRGPYLFPRYSTIQDKESKSTAILETQEDITLDSESERSANWKDQMKDMIKDARDSIMVDVKVLLMENMKEFMREMTMSLRNDITATMKDSINTKKANNK